MQTVHITLRWETLHLDLHASDPTKGICHYFRFELSLENKVDVLEVATATSSLAEVVTWCLAAMRRSSEHFDRLCPRDPFLDLRHFRNDSLPGDRTAYKKGQPLSMGDEVTAVCDAFDIKSEALPNYYRLAYFIVGWF